MAGLFDDIPTVPVAGNAPAKGGLFDDLPSAATTPNKSRSTKIDFETGAPAGVRAIVGGINNMEDRLATMRQWYPDAFELTEGDIYFTNPDTGLITRYNPEGLDVGDVVSVAREGTQLAGATLGGTFGAVGGLPGMAAGSTLGAGGGEELYKLTSQALGAVDTRSLPQHLGDTAIAGASGLGGPGGAVASAGVKGGVKTAMRGGKEGRREAVKAVQDLKRFDTHPSVAQATQKAWMDSLESGMSRFPGSAGVLRKRVKATSERVQKGIQVRADKLAGGRADPEMAGKTIKRGIEEGFIPEFKDKAGVLFGKLEQAIPADKPTPIGNYKAILEGLASPVPGAEATSAAIQNPALRRYLDALTVDLGAQSLLEGNMPFSAVMGVRRAIGQKLSGTDLIADVSRGELKAVYAALSRDIETAAAAHSDEALKAFKRANRYYSAGIGRVEDFLEPLAKKVEPERIFENLWSGSKAGPTKVRTVMRSLSPAERRVVASSYMQRLGRAPASQQNQAGDVFSFETFLTRWNQMDERAKDAVFNYPEMKGTRADLDRIARAAERSRESSRAFFNPSGTAGALTGTSLITGGTASGLVGAATGTQELIYFPVALAALSASSYGAARLLMTNRGFVRWLATATKVKPNGAAAHLGRLGGVAAASSIEDREAIYDYLRYFELPPDAVPPRVPPSNKPMQPKTYQETQAQRSVPVSLEQ